MMVRRTIPNAPLTPTLSPQGRGSKRTSVGPTQPTSPLRGEVDAQRRVRGSKARARSLRQNSTDAEARLWSVLRARQLGGNKFVRQFPIGPFVVDFVCRETALIIEVDGGQHAENARDERRTAYLSSEGYSVLRFWNYEVLGNLHGVQTAILMALENTPISGLRLTSAAHASTGRGSSGMRAATTKLRSLRLNTDYKSE
jgi:very-short-patch-repair endonuclease